MPCPDFWNPTRRPPKVTHPRPASCRVALRCGSCLPRGPQAAVTSASISAPAPAAQNDREGPPPLTQPTGQLGQRRARRVRHGRPARLDLLVLVGLAHGGPFLV